MATPKTFIIEITRRGRISYAEGTLEELIKYFGYTLECGASWEHEKGRKKINRNPKTAKSLATNLKSAVNNSAANGYTNTYYEVVTEKKVD
jgi:hypothetical protein